MLIVGLVSTREEQRELKFVAQMCIVRDRVKYLANQQKIKNRKRWNKLPATHFLKELLWEDYPDKLLVPMSVLVSTTPFIDRILLITTLPIESISGHWIFTKISNSPNSGWTSTISGIFPSPSYTDFSCNGLILNNANPIAMGHHNTISKLIVFLLRRKIKL